MKGLNKKKLLKSFIIGLVLIYLLGYIPARQAHFVIHRSSYVTSQSGRVTAGHWVVPGDLWFNVIGLIYLPLMPFEEYYWYIAVPLGSRWPYHPPLRQGFPFQKS